MTPSATLRHTGQSTPHDGELPHPADAPASAGDNHEELLFTERTLEIGFTHPIIEKQQEHD